MHEQARALHVGEELEPEARALARALDQARDIGHHELAVVALDRAEHRLESGERIVGHLRLRARDARQQRRLARVRQPDQPGVGQQLQPQLQRALNAGQSALGEARCLARGGGEVAVAAASQAAARHHRALAGLRQVVAELALGVVHHGAGRHPDLQRVRARAVAVRALAVPAAGSLVVRFQLEGLEVAQRRVADQHHIGTAAAVAAVGSAARHVGLAAEGDTAVPAGTALHEDLGAVVEHRPIVVRPTASP